MGLIDIDYQDTVNKARKIKSDSQSIMNKAKSDLSSSQIELQSCWKGDSSNKFSKKMIKADNSIYSAASAIKSTAQALENKANALKRVDDYAKSLWG